MGALYMVRKGSPGAKKILFIHGNMASTRWWDKTMAAMADEFDMMAVDLRGYGKSPDGPESVTLADHANDIRAMVQDVHFSHFTLVGHSLGGAVAMQFAALFPEMLDGLVLVDSAPVDGMKDINYELVQRMLDNSQVLLAALKATMIVPVDDEAWAVFTEDCLRGSAAVMANTRALDRADFSKAARSFTAPVLVVHGELDRVVPAGEAEKTALAYPKARLAVMSGVGHNPQVEDTKAFVKLLGDFVRDL